MSNARSKGKKKTKTIHKHKHTPRNIKQTLAAVPFLPTPVALTQKTIRYLFSQIITPYLNALNAAGVKVIALSVYQFEDFRIYTVKGGNVYTFEYAWGFDSQVGRFTWNHGGEKLNWANPLPIVGLQNIGEKLALVASLMGIDIDHVYTGTQDREVMSHSMDFFRPRYNAQRVSLNYSANHLFTEVFLRFIQLYSVTSIDISDVFGTPGEEQGETHSANVGDYDQITSLARNGDGRRYCFGVEPSSISPYDVSPSGFRYKGVNFTLGEINSAGAYVSAGRGGDFSDVYGYLGFEGL